MTTKDVTQTLYSLLTGAEHIGNLDHLGVSPATAVVDDNCVGLELDDGSRFFITVEEA